MLVFGKWCFDSSGIYTVGVGDKKEREKIIYDEKFDKNGRD